MPTRRGSIGPGNRAGRPSRRRRARSRRPSTRGRRRRLAGGSRTPGRPGSRTRPRGGRSRRSDERPKGGAPSHRASSWPSGTGLAGGCRRARRPASRSRTGNRQEPPGVAHLGLRDRVITARSWGVEGENPLGKSKALRRRFLHDHLDRHRRQRPGRPATPWPSAVPALSPPTPDIPAPRTLRRRPPPASPNRTPRPEGATLTRCHSHSPGTPSGIRPDRSATANAATSDGLEPPPRSRRFVAWRRS